MEMETTKFSPEQLKIMLDAQIHRANQAERFLKMKHKVKIVVDENGNSLQILEAYNTAEGMIIRVRR